MDHIVPSPRRWPGRSARLFCKDGGSSRNTEQRSFDVNNVIPEEASHPLKGMERSQSEHEEVQVLQQVEPNALPSNSTSEKQPPPGKDVLADTSSHVGTVANDEEQYNLKAPPPLARQENIESIALRCFSADHLNLMIREPTHFARFKKFLSEHRPQDLAPLQRYINTRKAIAAVDYANAVTQAANAAVDPEALPRPAATLDDHFEELSRQACAYLVEESLPAYITHQLVHLVTESLVKSITGTSAPVLTDLVPNLAELFCLTDPALHDSPIVYASDGFHSDTQYSKEFAIGRNCRFLQGPSTSPSAVRRLREAVEADCEVTETLLNYRRDGSAFINLIMIAPLYDNKGSVRYYLGCQIDVSPLISAGKGLESFAQLLREDLSTSCDRKSANALIGELGSMLSHEEACVLRNKANNVHSVVPSRQPSQRNPTGRDPRTLSRLMLGMEDVSTVSRENLDQAGGLSGVYRNYMLVRPFPSLRITFTSPTLRIPGLLQTRLMDRIEAPPQVRADIASALEDGSSFTARITWHSRPGVAQANSATDAPRPPTRDDSVRSRGQGPGSGSVGTGKLRWIHCTPLLGSDGRVGVWMVVMVEHEEVTGRLNRPWREQAASSAWPDTLDGRTDARYQASDADRLYADYLRTDGNESRMTTRSAQNTSDVDDHFRDF